MQAASLIRRYCRRGRAALATVVIVSVAVGVTAGGIVDDATDSSHFGAVVFATVTAVLLSLVRRLRRNGS